MPAKSRTATPTTPAVTAASAARSIAFLLSVDDANRASLAVLLAAADEIEQNSRFAARVRAAYDLLPPSKAPRPTGSSRTSDAEKILTSTLTPIRHVEGHEINLAAPLDPYFLLEVYGAHQLREALDLFPLAKLKEGVEAVMERNPGTKPKSKSSKAAVVDYIVQYASDATISS